MGATFTRSSLQTQKDRLFESDHGRNRWKSKCFLLEDDVGGSPAAVTSLVDIGAAEVAEVIIAGVSGSTETLSGFDIRGSWNPSVTPSATAGFSMLNQFSPMAPATVANGVEYAMQSDGKPMGRVMWVVCAIGAARSLEFHLATQQFV